MELVFDNRAVEVKNLDRVYFGSGTIKGEIIEYYIKMWKYMERHLVNRPISMIFFPSGSVEDSFYQKQCPHDAYNFVERVALPSSKRGKIDYVMINNLASAVYLVNKSAVEMHCWFSRYDKKVGITSLDFPDIAAIDLDPSGRASFSDAVRVARAINEVLKEFGVYSVCKTSGASGLHIFIPIKRGISFSEVQLFLGGVCGLVESSMPSLCTRERVVKRRGDRVYLDAVQCNYGKTLAMPYSIRVKSGGLVSAPLEWSEVEKGLDPRDFNMGNMLLRIEKVGDLMKDFYYRKQSLPLFN